MIETVHLLKRSSKINYHVVFLLLPVIIFGFVLVLYLVQIHSETNLQVARTNQESAVLGKEDLLDNPTKGVQNRRR